MNIKRAIGFSLLVYLVTFILGVIITYTSDLTLEAVKEASAGFWITNIIGAIIIEAVITWWFFRSPKTSPSLKNGFYFGLTTIIVGAIVDILLFIPYIVTTGEFSEVVAYYSLPWFWLIVLLIIVTATLTGKLLADKNHGSL